MARLAGSPERDCERGQGRSATEYSDIFCLSFLPLKVFSPFL